MSQWQETLVHKDQSLLEVLATIDAAELQIALVVDGEHKLMGLITDGDIRRGLLRGLPLTAKAYEVMTTSPQTACLETTPPVIEKLMLERQLKHIPILDAAGRLIDLAVQGLPYRYRRYHNQVFIMAGGLGSRLGDLTRETPKPLLHVGDKPILETIIRSFLNQGFYRFTLAVNYRSELIEAYFDDGSRWGAEIDYLHEDEPLGTCGALSLLQAPPSEAFFLMNGDILTNLRFTRLLDYHQEHQALATLAVRSYEVQVPFGVVEYDSHRVRQLVEKPVHQHLVNAGIYVLEPACLELIPLNTRFDMTDLIQALLQAGKPVSHYLLQDYWLDIGRLSDFEKANDEFEKIWSDT